MKTLNVAVGSLQSGDRFLAPTSVDFGELSGTWCEVGDPVDAASGSLSLRTANGVVSLKLDMATEVALEVPEDWEQYTITLMPVGATAPPPPTEDVAVTEYEDWEEDTTDAVAMAEYIDETFGPNLEDAVWDEDVTANGIVHDFMWRHGPIPWVEFNGDPGRLQAFYAGSMIALICRLGAREFLRRVPSMREMALLEMAEALSATDLDCPADGRPESALAVARIHLNLYDERDDEDDLESAAEAIGTALYRISEVDVAQPSIERVQSDLVHPIAERLDTIGQRGRGDELRELLRLYGLCDCDACTDARVRGIAALPAGASFEVWTAVAGEVDKFTATLRSLDGTIALVEAAEGSREVDLRHTMIWPD
jgi:hypothetical protein